MYLPNIDDYLRNEQNLKCVDNFGIIPPAVEQKHKITQSNRMSLLLEYGKRSSKSTTASSASLAVPLKPSTSQITIASSASLVAPLKPSTSRTTIASSASLATPLKPSTLQSTTARSANLAVPLKPSTSQTTIASKISFAKLQNTSKDLINFDDGPSTMIQKQTLKEEVATIKSSKIDTSSKNELSETNEVNNDKLFSEPSG